jgi:hypothetical protein
VTISNEQTQQLILGDLAAVGNAKPLGYLPLAALKARLLMDVREVVDSFEKRGLRTKVFQADDCCIKSGALYVYSPTVLQNVLNAFSDVLKANAWPLSAELFVNKVAKTWVEQTHPVYAVIRNAFGEPS